MKIYTGVGSRQTPPAILSLMFRIAKHMAVKGHLLRSGGAIGADSAFEAGCRSVAGSECQIFRANQATEAAIDLASSFHPAWNRCNDYARKLHGRNMFQVLGLSLTEPSAGLICWTPHGQLTGGTSTAIRCAIKHQIPVYNLAFAEIEDKFETWLF